MHSVYQLQKQQVGLRLPKYLIEKIDEWTQKYNLNRTDVITEAIQSYLAEQEAEEFYNNFDKGCKELKEVLENPKKISEKQTLDEFLDEL